jgi:hypothetical protein
MLITLKSFRVQKPRGISGFDTGLEDNQYDKEPALLILLFAVLV